MHSTRPHQIADLSSISPSSSAKLPLISDSPVKRKGEVIDGGGGNRVDGFQETYTFFKQVAVGNPGRYSRSGDNFR